MGTVMLHSPKQNHDLVVSVSVSQFDYFCFPYFRFPFFFLKFTLLLSGFIIEIIYLQPSPLASLPPCGCYRCFK